MAPSLRVAFLPASCSHRSLGRYASFVAFCLGIAALGLSGQTLAFPGAEGFGRFASGGRGGDVYIVTNLNDSGAGSLREGVVNRSVDVPRTVVFAVSGTIFLQSTLRITKGNLTIAGQTAPGDGICLAYRPLDISNSSNVILRFLRVRLGDVAGVESDAFTSRYGSRLIIDHCSFSWSVDETSSTYDNTDLTLQWCFITESLRDSVHSKGPHGYGGIWGGLGATYHHNLIAHHDSRNPRFNGARTHGTSGEFVDMRNNVIYNWRGNSTYGGEPTDTGIPARHNMVNNTYKPGPATSSTSAIRYRILEPTRNSVASAAGFADLSLFHIAGNWTTASSAVATNNWNGGVQVVPSSEFSEMRAATAFEAPSVVTQSAQNSYTLVLARAGCRLPVRDVIDTRIASEVANGTATYRGSINNYAGIIDSQADVGGWPVLASTSAPTDADHDGMPDVWETARGLNPALASDRNLVPDPAAGYTNLELYLNELAAPAFPLPTLSASPAARSVDVGAPFTLSVSATAPAETGALSYQWYRDGAALSGATAAAYTVSGATTTDAGAYHVLVGNGYGTAASDVAVVTVRTSYETWLLTHGLDPATTGAPTADPAGDGVPNLLKFALGGDPARPGSTPLPTLGRGDGGSVAFVYDVKTAALTDHEIGAEVSTDLVSWTAVDPGADGTSISATALDAGTDRVTIRFGAHEPRFFVRLRVAVRP